MFLREGGGVGPSLPEGPCSRPELWTFYLSLDPFFPRPIFPYSSLDPFFTHLPLKSLFLVENVSGSVGPSKTLNVSQVLLNSYPLFHSFLSLSPHPDQDSPELTGGSKNPRWVSWVVIGEVHRSDSKTKGLDQPWSTLSGRTSGGQVLET